jgi:hypothetical protein
MSQPLEVLRTTVEASWQRRPVRRAGVFGSVPRRAATAEPVTLYPLAAWDS